MPSVPLSLLSRKNCTKKEAQIITRLPLTFDLEFYEYNFLTFILWCQCKVFLVGRLNERSNNIPMELAIN